MDRNGYRREYEADSSPILKILWLASIVLTLLLGATFWMNSEREVSIPYDGDLGSVRYIVAQLAEDLTDLNAKHSRLQHEMQVLSEQLDATSGGVELVRADVVAARTRRPRQDLGDHHGQTVKDFAMESAGARVIDTGGTEDYVLYDSSVSWLLHMLSAVLCRGCDGARAMLRPGVMPGECWAFHGSRGEATIQLLGRVNVTGVTLEHIPVEVAPTGDISSAPRRFQLEGVESPSAKNGYGLGTFEYDREGRPTQYFAVQRPAPRDFNLVRLRFLSNWGHPLYTCVYRVSVHGQLSPGQGHIAHDREPGGDYE